MKKRLSLMLVFCAALLMAFGCARRPFPSNPLPEEEADVYRSARLALYEGMPKSDAETLFGREPLIVALGPDRIEQVYIFRADVSPGDTEASHGTTYLRLFIDRATGRVESWE